VAIVDTAFVGRLGTASVAALAVASAVLGIAFFMFSFLAHAVGPLLAQDIGGRKQEAARTLTANGLAVALLGGVVVLVILEVFAPQLLRLAGATDNLIEPATQYLRVRSLAVPALLLITLGNGVFRGHADTVTPLWIALGFNVINAVLDPVFIFGLDLGLVGAAWASVIAQWSGAVAFVGVLVVRSMLASPRLAGSARLLRVSRDFLIRTGALVLTFFIATRVAASISEAALAAHQVAGQVFLFVALATDSLAVAGQVMVGQKIGAGDAPAARAVADRLIMLGLMTGLGMAIVVVAFRRPVGRVFLSDPAALAELDIAFLVLAPVVLIGALAFVWDGLVMGAGDFGFLARTMTVAGGLTIATLLTVQAQGWGLAGVWWALVLLMVLRSLMMVPWHRRLGSAVE
jgi:MATE family multidrug resistance protein